MTLVSISACAVGTSREQPDFCLGIVYTTVQRQSSIIDLYDDDLNIVSTQTFAFGGIGPWAGSSQVYDHHFYSIPTGLTMKDLEITLEYDMLTGAFQTYSMGAASMSTPCATNEYIFTSSNLNREFFLRRMDRRTSELTVVDLDGLYADHIAEYGGLLYVFGNKEASPEDTPYLYIVQSDSMDIQEKVDLSDLSSSNQDSMEYDGKIYIPSSTYYRQHNRVNPSLLQIDMKDHSISRIPLTEDMPYEVKRYGSTLIISHYDFVGGFGSKITLLDLDSKEQDVHTLQNNVSQIDVKGDTLYVLDCVEKTMSSYSLPDLSVIKSVNIDQHSNWFVYYYTPCFFVR